MNNIYYAHSKLIYSDEREEDESSWLRIKYDKVTCPHYDLGDLGSQERYFDVISKCDAIVCSEFVDHVGRGVYGEINYALKHDIPVYCMRKYNGNYRLHKVVSIIINDEDDWSRKYAKLNLK